MEIFYFGHISLSFFPAYRIITIPISKIPKWQRVLQPTIIGSLSNFVISFFLVAYLKIGVLGIIYAQLLSGVIVFSILTYKFVVRLPFSLNKSILSESLKISYPLTPTIFFGVIGSHFNKYIIALVASLGGVGIYSIAQKVASLVFTYMTALQNVFSPQVYKKMFDLKEKGGQSVGVYLTPFIYISIALAMMAAIFSEEIIYIMTPSSYHGAIDIVTILAMYYGFLFFGKITPMQLIYTKKTYLCTILSMVSIGLNVVLNIFFIMEWGVIGAAWGTFLAALISGSIYFAVSQHYYDIKWEYKKMGAIFFIFFVSAILIILMRHFSVAYEFRLIFKCVSVFSYIYLGVKLQVITMENYTLIRNMIPFRRVVTSDQA